MNIHKKIAEVQSTIGKISKEKENPYFKSNYFDINQLLDQLMPLLKKNGLTVIQPLSNINGKSALKTLVIDLEDGENITYATPLTENPDPQKMGSAITYFRRYALQSLFCLQAEDDDANFASAAPIKTAPSKKSRDVAQDATEHDAEQELDLS